MRQLVFVNNINNLIKIILNFNHFYNNNLYENLN